MAAGNERSVLGEALGPQDPGSRFDELGSTSEKTGFQGGIRAAYEGGTAKDLLRTFPKKGWVFEERHVPYSEDALRSCACGSPTG